MTAQDYLYMLRDQMHTVVLATVGSDGSPYTCAIDIMLADTGGLYFLTARGKSLYHRLQQDSRVALTGVSGGDTLSSRSISLQGRVREIGSARLPEIFAQNPYMQKIYPSADSRAALTVFCLYTGSGEYFDLSCQPIFRQRFSIGDGVLQKVGYYVTKRCTGCGRCQQSCPQNCIDCSRVPVQIIPSACLHCGRCQQVCPQNAIERSRP